MSSFWCELAWLGGLRPEPGVVLEVEGETISSVQTRRGRERRRERSGCAVW